MADEHNIGSKREHGKRKALFKFVICLVIFFLASVFLAVSGMIIPAILTVLLFCGCLYGFVQNLRDGWKNVDRKLSDQEQQAGTVKTEEQIKNEETAVLIAEKTLKILSELTLEGMGTIEDGFSSDAEEFYSSAESRDAEKCRDFRSEKEEKWKRMIADYVLEKLEDEHAYVFKAYKKGVEEFMRTEAKGPSDIYNAVKYGMLHSLDYKGNEYSTIGSEPRTDIQECESRIYRIAEETTGKLWKPIHVLSGSYGSYCKCICFDEEMNVFFRLSPDDNYYHWGGYDLLPVSEEEAKAELHAEIPWHEDPTERSKYSFADSDPEFTSRIR